MTPYYDESGQSILHGDCLRVLPLLSAERFTTVITDPPYHLTTGKKGGTGPASVNLNTPYGRARIGTGFMGKAWDGGDVAFRPETWKEVLRVCKPGAILLAFGGTRTFHRLTCAIEDAGWEIRDCMSWLYGSGFPKSLGVSKALDKAAGAERRVLGPNPTWRETKRDNGQSMRPVNGGSAEVLTAPATGDAETWDGWGTALKPAWEPIIVAMKPLAGTFAENALRHGVAGLNIDGGRIGTDSTRRPQNDGPTWSGKFNGGQRVNGSEAGRWPANVLLDEEAATQLDAEVLAAGLGRPDYVRSERAFSGWGKHGELSPAQSPQYLGDKPGASRFFYTAKASKSDRGHGNDHPTVKPTDLLKYLCVLTATPTGGEILDPFGGSMTTLVAARECGRRALAIELEEEHCRIGAKRLAQGVLFGAA